MGYELHIVKTRDWAHSASKPITKAEVDGVVASDTELSWSGTNSIETNNVKIELKGHHAILWRGKHSMWWNGREITCKNPSEAEITKMFEIASSLNAMVIGDEGEIYRIETGPLGNKILVVPE